MNNERDRKANVTVHVNNNIERALRQLKKKMEKDGVVRDIKRIVYHEPPTQKRRKRLMRAIKQNFMRTMAQRSVQ